MYMYTPIIDADPINILMVEKITLIYKNYFNISHEFKIFPSMTLVAAILICTEQNLMNKAYGYTSNLYIQYITLDRVFQLVRAICIWSAVTI